MFHLKNSILACIVFAGVILAMDTPITVVPPANEDCRRFDDYYLQAVALIHDVHRLNCNDDMALVYGKRLHELRFGVGSHGCFQAAANVYNFNKEVLAYVRKGC